MFKTLNMLLLLSLFLIGLIHSANSLYAVGCEGSELNIQCTNNTLIRIISAIYGRIEPAVCYNDQLWNQIFQNFALPCTKNIDLTSRCNSQASCSIPTTSSVYGDPCSPSIPKYVEVYYDCIKILELKPRATSEIFLKATIQKAALKLTTQETRANISWFSSNELIVKYENKILEFDFDEFILTGANQLFTSLSSSVWESKFGTTISVKISSDNLPYPLLEDSYFVGLKGVIRQITFPITSSSQPVNIPVYEGNFDKVDIRFYSTLPLVCKTNDMNCSLNFFFETRTGGPDLLRLTDCPDYSSPSNVNSNPNYCQLLVNKEKFNDPEKGGRWCFVGTTTSSNLRFTDIEIQGQISIVASENVKDSFWSKFNFPQIKFTFKPKPQSFSSYAYCNNDPHCGTNDGKPFEFQNRPGEYLVYENENLEFRVHFINVPCRQIPGYPPTYWLWVYCLKSIYIQSKNEFVQFDINTFPRLIYRDLSLSKPPSIGITQTSGIWYPPNGNKSFRVEILANTFDIISHFGTRVQINKAGDSFRITPSRFDFDSVFGLLGNLNSNPADDFIRTKFGNVESLTQYFDAYKVPPNRLFSNGFFYPFNQTSDSKKYCRCFKSVTNETKEECSLGLLQTSTTFNAGRRRRDVSTQTFDLDELMAKTNLTFEQINEFINNTVQTNSTWLFANQSTCNSLATDNVLVECDRRGIINLNNKINECLLDFNASNDDIWTSIYRKDLLTVCLFVAQNDYMVWDTSVGADGSIQYNEPTNFINQLCKNNCSMNGKCENGVCVCNDPFSGDDCSLNLRSSSKILKTSFEKNMCDVRTQNCTELLIFAEKLTSNQIMDSTLSTYSLEKQNSPQNIQRTLTYPVYALTENHALMILDYQENLKFELRIPYDKSKSAANLNKISLLIYDSSCFTCTSAELPCKTLPNKEYDSATGTCKTKEQSTDSDGFVISSNSKITNSFILSSVLSVLMICKLFF